MYDAKSGENTMLMTQEQEELQKMYCKRISARYSGYSEEELQFIFSPFFSPDVWEDVTKVFFHSLQAFLPLEGSEIPLVFVGAHMQNRLTRKREGVGFLLTDKVIYVQEGGLFGDNLSKVFPLTISDVIYDSALKLVAKATESFDWTALDSIASASTQASLRSFLAEAVLDVLLLKQEFGIEHIARHKAQDVKGRIVELGLKNNTCIKCGDEEKHLKHFKKVFKKFGIPTTETIQIAITDSTLAGPYGMVITDKGIHSKDLMEDAVHTDRSLWKENYPIRLKENVIVIGDGQAHMLPDSLKDSEKNNVKMLISEVLAGEIA